MSNHDRYRQNAIDCLRLASEANDPGAKAVLLDMAQSWVRLADQAEKNLRTDLVYETPPSRAVPGVMQQQQQIQPTKEE